MWADMEARALINRVIMSVVAPVGLLRPRGHVRLHSVNGSLNILLYWIKNQCFGGIVVREGPFHFILLPFPSHPQNIDARFGLPPFRRDVVCLPL